MSAAPVGIPGVEPGEEIKQRLCPGQDAAQALTLEDCIVMFIDDVFDALEDQLLHGGQHGG